MSAAAPSLTGLHHLTAVAADAPSNHRFYTRPLGMHLVKRPVNQPITRAWPMSRRAWPRRRECGCT